MQILNMLPGIEASGSVSGETELPANAGKLESQDDLSTFVAQLEWLFSQHGQEVEAGQPWSVMQISEEGELLDQSGNPLPFPPLVNGQSLPLQMVVQAPGGTAGVATLSIHPDQSLLQTGQQPLPLGHFLRQIKMAPSGEQPQLSPPTSGQVNLQPQAERSEMLSNLPALRVTGNEVSTASALSELSSVTTTTLERAHLPASFATLQQAVATTTTQSTLPQLPGIGLPVGGRGWGEHLAERIQWMVRQDIQGAEVKLNPRGLGPIEIRVTVQNDQTNVSFVAQHAVTREALDAAIPRLREMFGESNMSLVNVDVSDRNSPGSNGMAPGSEGANGHAEGDEAMISSESENVGSAGGRLVSDGILDDYA